MKTYICQNCGANDFEEKEGVRICKYCGSKFYLTAEDKKPATSTIELNEDVTKLLKKCKNDPAHAERYANRILEIDPYNQEAKRILNKPSEQKSGCYVATCVYGSYDCPEVWTLRRFRDDLLGRTWYGRAFIRLYYMISPILVRLFGKTNWFKRLWKPALDRMVARLKDRGIEDTPYSDRIW